MIPRSLPLQAVGERSPVIPFIFRCSLLTREFPWLRYPPGGWNQSCFCSLHLSLASSLFLSPSFPLLPTFRGSSALQRSWPRSSPFLRRGPVDWSGGRPQLWRRVEESTRRIKTDCIHDCTLHSSADPRGDRTFALYVSSRKRKPRRRDEIQTVVDERINRWLHHTSESQVDLPLAFLHWILFIWPSYERKPPCVNFIERPDYNILLSYKRQLFG